MQVSILRETIDEFSQALSQGWTSGLEALYEATAHWKANWPPDSPGQLSAVLDRALESRRTRSFWQGHAYYPKESLMQLADFDPQTANLAFGLLFNETYSLAERFRGFSNYLDELKAEFTRQHPTKTFISHYHGDYRAASMYCALQFPDTHAYLEDEVYTAALHRLRARNVERVASPDRFEKSVRAINTFLHKHPDLREVHRARLRPGDYRQPSALLVSEYLRYLSQPNS